MKRTLTQFLAFLVLSSIIFSCGKGDSLEILNDVMDRISEDPYRLIGDIPADPSLDDPNFSICGGEANVAQYFHFGNGLEFAGEQIAIKRIFAEQYQPVETTQSGMIRIRFIVNCEGETGRFRLIQADQVYQEITFDPAITDQLLQITKDLKGWTIQEAQYGPTNYYQYLVFVIENGSIKQILP